jgi:hypothetical protein
MFEKLVLLLAACNPFSLCDGTNVEWYGNGKPITLEESRRKSAAIDRSVEATLKRADEINRSIGLTPKALPVVPLGGFPDKK